MENRKTGVGRILRRYILRELLVPFSISILFFTAVFLVGNLVKLADLLVNKGVDLWDILRLLVLLVPSLLNYIVPTSALAAVLLVFGSLAQNNEITAIKAGGINLFSVTLPVLLVSFFGSLVMLFISDQIGSDAEFASRRLIKEIIFKRPTAYLEAGKFIKDFQNYIILTQRIEGNRIYEVTIYQPQENGKATRTIMAEWGEIIASKDDKTLRIKLYNGTSDEPNPDDPGMFYKLDFKTFELPPIHLGKEELHKIKKKVREMRLDEILSAFQRDPNLKSNAEAQREYNAALHKKISFAFALFVFTLVGLPIAIITRHGEAVISFALSIAIVALYYILFVWGWTLALQGSLPPPLAMWLPNFFMLGCGVFLMRRVLSV